MPSLDRRVTVRVSSQGVNDFGESVETRTDFPVWAMLVQDRLARNIEVGGVYSTAGRVWRVRFNQAFIDALGEEGMLSVLPGDGADPDIITGIGEPTDRGETRRRRYLDLLS